MTGMKRRALMVGLVGGLFYVGVASAADPRLDQADAAIEKAIVLLKAAQGNGNPPFGGHRNNAVNHLEKARSEIAKAKAFADKPPPKPEKPGKDKEKGNRGKHK